MLLLLCEYNNIFLILIIILRIRGLFLLAHLSRDIIIIIIIIVVAEIRSFPAAMMEINKNK